MANRRPQTSGRRMDFGRNDRGNSFGRSGVSPWQGGGGPGSGLPNLLPLAGGSTEATLALASNIINLLQPRQNPVPSLLDMPIRRDFGANLGRYDRGYGPNRMGNQGNFRRTGNYNRAGERINTNRKPFRPNDGQRQQNKSSPKKDADSKAKPVKESSHQEDKNAENAEQSEVKEEKEEGKKDTPKSCYDDINAQLLKCHICNKSMWDAKSFDNHLSGRAHAIMMQQTAESYALTADTMRQEFKIGEMKRNRKTGQQPARDFYCAMCNMYAGDGAIHRTTVGHRKLKKYLHPTCTICHKEMPTRIELDEHRLTAEHLKNMQDKQEVVSKPKPEVMVISTLTAEQFYLQGDRHRWRRLVHREDRRVKQENKDTQAEIEEKKDQEANVDIKKEPGEPEEKKEDDQDFENTILDYKEGDDVTNATLDMFPTYTTERGVGRSFLTEFRCVQCRLCHKLLDTDETAEVHLRTWRHHQLFLRLLTDKTSKSKDGQEQNQDTAKRPSNSEENGNWKRRKTTTEGEDADEDMQNGQCDEDVSTKEASVEGDAAVPAAEELEDWEQSVDEILADEGKLDKKGKEEEPEQEEVSEATEEKPEEKAPEDPPPAATPTTGTPRGRGRGRGRYGRRPARN